MDQHHGSSNSFTKLAPSDADPTASTPLQGQILLILVGLPGSSKSTFSNALVHHSHSPSWSQPADVAPLARPWARVSQDEAPSRRRQECERRVREALTRGENVMVDRVNFDATQRAHFVEIADAYQPRPRVWALILDVSASTLGHRLAARPYHPTIPDAATGARVLSQMLAIWSPPSANGGEGFDRIFTLRESQQPADGAWTLDHCRSLLKDIEEKGSRERGPRRVAQPSSRGRGRGGHPWPRGYQSRPTRYHQPSRPTGGPLAPYSQPSGMAYRPYHGRPGDPPFSDNRSPTAVDRRLPSMSGHQNRFPERPRKPAVDEVASSRVNALEIHEDDVQ